MNYKVFKDLSNDQCIFKQETGTPCLICILWPCFHHLIRSDEAQHLNGLVYGRIMFLTPMNSVVKIGCTV